MKLECFIFFKYILLESNWIQLEFTDYELDVFNNILKNNIGWSHESQEGRYFHDGEWLAVTSQSLLP